MSDFSDPYDRHGYRKGARSRECDIQGNHYRCRVCLYCNSEIAAPASRIGWVFRQHVQRCETATAEERAIFRRTRRWPRRKTMVPRKP